MVDLLPAWLGFLVVMALGQFSPGPDMVLLTRTALMYGRKAGCWTAVGIACGLALHAGVAVTGVALLFGAEGGVMVQVLKWLGVGYLCWLGVGLIRSGFQRGSIEVAVGAATEETAFRSWKRGLLCNLLNPKVAIFLAGVSAPFLAMGDDGDMVWPTVLWLTIVLEGLILWCLWVFLLQLPLLRKKYLALAHWFDLLFGAVILGLAVLLVITV